MPRPVLSETTFNADNIATSILQQANLQITNDNLGVTDISGFISGASGVNQYTLEAYAFNGFVFFAVEYRHENSVPSSGETLSSITDSTYHPITNFVAPVLGNGGDQGAFIRAESDGDIKIYAPTGNSGHWFGTVNMWWRYTSV